MTERFRLGSFGRRLAASFLVGSLVSLAVLFGGVIVTHWLRRNSVDLHETQLLLAAVVVAALTAVAVSAVMAKRLSRPIEGYVAMARSVAAGDLTARPPAAPPPEFADLTDALVAAADELERASRARRQLNDDIAHELRTPLAALQAGLEELRDGYCEPDPARLASLHAQAVRMGRMLEDLAALSAARSARLHLDLQPVDLRHLVTEAAQAWRGPMAAAGLRVVLAADGPAVMVVADAGRVHQMVGNLLANAVQHCRNGDRVRIEVAQSADAGVVVVADSGPGLSPQELPLVFDRGWRSAAATGTAGSGLGLPIVQALAIAQGGSATAAHAPEGGLAVTLRLPLAGAEWMRRAGNSPTQAQLAAAP